MSAENETIEDIRQESEAKLRDELKKMFARPPDPLQVLRSFNDMFDRIEAAVKLEREKLSSCSVRSTKEAARIILRNGTVNAAKMYEALEFLIKHKEWLRGHNLTMTLEDLEVIDRILDKAEAALAAPPRNCYRFADAKTARQSWLDDAENWDEFGSPNLELHEWLFAPATERKGYTNGSK